jgi:hypothetical protein
MEAEQFLLVQSTTQFNSLLHFTVHVEAKQGFSPPLLALHLYGNAGKDNCPETLRVKSSGAWIYDGRVCNILAVTRAFGDWEFKVGGKSVRWWGRWLHSDMHCCACTHRSWRASTLGGFRLPLNISKPLTLLCKSVDYP